MALFLIKCPPYWMLLVAGSIRNIPGYALGAWLPTFYVRRFGLTPSDYSIIVGVVVLFGGGLGSFLGGFISDRYPYDTPPTCMWRHVRPEKQKVPQFNVVTH